VLACAVLAGSAFVAFVLADLVLLAFALAAFVVAGCVVAGCAAADGDAAGREVGEPVFDATRGDSLATASIAVPASTSVARCLPGAEAAAAS